MVEESNQIPFTEAEFEEGEGVSDASGIDVRNQRLIEEQGGYIDVDTEDPASESKKRPFESQEQSRKKRRLSTMDQIIPAMDDLISRVEERDGADNILASLLITRVALKVKKNKLEEKADKLKRESEKLKRESEKFANYASMVSFNPLVSLPSRRNQLLEEANSYYQGNDFQKAIPLYEKLLPPMIRQYGDDHINITKIRTRLSNAYLEVKDGKKAIPLYEKILPIYISKYGEDHINVALARWRLANSYYLVADYLKAIPLYEKILPIYISKYGEDHINITKMRSHLASSYYAVADYRKAIPLFENILPVYISKYGEDHAVITKIMTRLSYAYLEVMDWKKAIPLYEKILPIYISKYGEDHINITKIRDRIAVARRQAGTKLYTFVVPPETTGNRIRLQLQGLDNPPGTGFEVQLPAAASPGMRMRVAVPLGGVTDVLHAYVS